jgi:hypothetical protein
MVVLIFACGCEQCSPLLDPLHFGKSTNENYGRYTTICKSDEDDWKGEKLNQMAQEAQNDWYGKWIAEMARIAKPGVPVIVEQVSPPYCNAFFVSDGPRLFICTLCRTQH